MDRQGLGYASNLRIELKIKITEIFYDKKNFIIHGADDAARCNVAG